MLSGNENPCHATCVAFNGDGVLICGRPGAGKSDLALRLMERGFDLVADDAVLLRNDGGVLRASPPETLAGMVEVRGVGVVTAPFVENVAVKLKIVLSGDEKIDRMPENAVADICGVVVPCFVLNGFEPSAAAKVRCALNVATGKQKRVE
jgi:serine kinase of HPr protein (carbohydrate metabolism regulator)